MSWLDGVISARALEEDDMPRGDLLLEIGAVVCLTRPAFDCPAAFSNT